MTLNDRIIQLDFTKRDTLETLWWCWPHKFIEAETADTVSRPTEDEAIENIVDAARRKFRYRSDVFTTNMRHAEMVMLADYAVRMSVTPTSFAAGVLNYSREQVRRVLIEAGFFDHNVAENDEYFDSSIESSEHRKRRQPENRVQKIMASGTKPCPAHGYNRFCKGHAYGCDALCEECFKVYTPYRENWPQWLVFLVKDDQREARRQAQESVLHLELFDDIAA